MYIHAAAKYGSAGLAGRVAATWPTASYIVSKVVFMAALQSTASAPRQLQQWMHGLILSIPRHIARTCISRCATPTLFLFLIALSSVVSAFAKLRGVHTAMLALKDHPL